MKHNIYTAIAFYCFIFISTCPAMEITKTKQKDSCISQIKILKELSCAPYPVKSIYLNKNRAIIKTSIDEIDTYSIINPSNDNLIANILEVHLTLNYCLNPTNLAIHPNKKIFALYNQQSIKIYDAEAANLIWEKKNTKQKEKIKNIYFDSSDNTLFLMNYRVDEHGSAIYELKSHNYKKENNNILIDNNNDSILINKSPHDTELSCTNFLYNQKKSLIHFIDNKIGIKTINTDTYHIEPITSIKLNFSPFANIEFHDSMIMYIDTNNYKLNGFEVSTKTINLFRQSKCGHCLAITTHPNNTILAELSKAIDSNDVYLTYWDVKKQQPIHMEKLPFKEKPRKTNHILSAIFEEIPVETIPNQTNHSLSFSFYGNELMITSKNGTFIIETDFEAIYQPNTKEKMRYLLHALNDEKNNFIAMNIPNDIIITLKQYLICLFKR